MNAEPRPTMYSVFLSLPANAMFCGARDSGIVPRCAPFTSNTSTPADVAAYTRPASSIARPSAPLVMPLGPVVAPWYLAKLRRLASVPSA